MRKLHVKEFKQLLKLYDIKLSEMAKIVGIKREVFAQMLNAKTRYLTQDVIDKIKEATKQDPFEEQITLYSDFQK